MDRSQKTKGLRLRVDDFCASGYSSCDVGPFILFHYQVLFRFSQKLAIILYLEY